MKLSKNKKIVLKGVIQEFSRGNGRNGRIYPDDAFLRELDRISIKSFDRSKINIKWK